MTKPEALLALVLLSLEDVGVFGDKCAAEAMQGHRYEFVLGDLLGGPVDETSPFNAGGAGSIHGRKANIPRAVGCSQKIFLKEESVLDLLTSEVFELLFDLLGAKVFDTWEHSQDQKQLK